MSESNGERREQQEGENTVRVNDRRRIRLDEEGNPQPVEPQEAAEDVRPEDLSAEAPQSVPAEAYEQLQKELEASRRRVDELARAYQALDRDREEFKQRLQRERDRMLDVEKGNAASLVLEAVDELDRCLSASATDDSALAKGVRFIREGLVKKLQAQGVELIEVLGKPFDPNTAEAIDMDVTPNADEDQMVLSEVRAGYQYKGRILRPARVKVAKFVPPAQA